MPDHTPSWVGWGGGGRVVKYRGKYQKDTGREREREKGVEGHWRDRE